MSTLSREWAWLDFDLIIRNGTVVDGTGRSRFRANLGLQGPGDDPSASGAG